jgi:pentafunctional AROM polypeptide
MTTPIFNMYNSKFTKLKELQILDKYNQIVIITDDNVYKYYSEEIVAIQKHYQSKGIFIFVYQIPHGEGSKNLETKLNIEKFMFENNVKRAKSCVVALGGGVVGDLSGFVASTYKRGIDFIQVPTTILAMVDSSIGGKTGINNDFGKNLIGAFYNPKYILIFMDFINTLPREEVINGFAEIIKTAAINNKNLWNILIKNNINSVLNHRPLMFKIIQMTSTTKMKIVKEDAYDTAVANNKQLLCPREHLNFGHTIGHIIEYSQGLKHGYAVAIGMILELRLKENNEYLVPITIRNQIIECIRKYELPTNVENIKISQISKYLKHDKKDGRIVLIDEIGHSYTKTCTLNQIIECMTVERKLTHQNINNFITYNGPGSKSETNRVLILASLGRGKCIIKNALLSDDTLHMIKALQTLGIDIKLQNNDIVVVGNAGNIDFKGERTLFLGNSGTSMRFLTSLMILLNKGIVNLTGVERMKERPIGDLVSALKIYGINIFAENNNNNPPIRVEGINSFKSCEIFLNCSVSSQYLTGLLMVAPSILGGLKINVLNKLVSSKFIEMTLIIMNNFGLNVDYDSELKHFTIKHQIYDNPEIYNIEADASSCSYPIAYSIINKIPIYIPNLTSNNIQGDLFYSTEVIKKFGIFDLTCDEDGTKISNYVHNLKGIGEIDMDSSDTFLTIGVLAALSDGVTKIVNIDNQNVKECERIDVLYNHLKKAGVDIKLDNLELTINGNPQKRLKNIFVDCHDDHRIAMSFSLLSVSMDELIISDYTCVNKTYPNFWKDMSSLGLQNEIVKKQQEKKTTEWNYKSKKPIILVGMPCSGKSYVAKELSKLYSLTYCDCDSLFEQIYQFKPENFISQYGWERFREYEYQILKDNYTKYDIISTGGGIIEYEKSRKLLLNLKKQTNSLIIYIDTKPVTIKQRYMKRKRKAPYKVSIEELYSKRKDYYEDVSNYKYKSSHKRISEQLSYFTKFFRNINEKREILPNSYFVCIPFNQIRENFHNLEEMTDDADALELRVDFCPKIEDNLEYIENIIGRVQKKVNIPLILTTRSTKEWGKFDGDNNLLGKLIDLFIKLGVEYIDHELSCNFEIEDRKHSNIIGSCHTKNFNILKHNVEYGLKKHKPDILKVVVSYDIYEKAKEFLSQFDIKQIFIAIGSEASFTRVMNKYLTPVTSNLIDSTAPGQLTYKQINEVRNIILKNKEKEYYIFGFPIKKSPSPFIHNYVFDKFKQNCIYSRYETKYVEDVLNVMKRPNFHGTSITIPLKEKMMSHMDILTEHAKNIGAINTIIKTDDNKFTGDNTDYLAIRDAIINFDKKFTTGCIVGNGGTAKAACYALNQLNIPCNIYCRNKERASKTLKNFVIDNFIESMTLNNDCSLVIICVPPRVNINYDNLKPNTCIINMAYVGKDVKLIDREDLNIVEGFSILYKQAFYQYKLWNNIKNTDEKNIEEFYKIAMNLF